MARVLRSVVIGFALFFLVDGLVFRSSLYWRWIAPTSSIGSIKNATQSIADAERIAGTKTVLVMGDSRVGEGFSFVRANARAAELHNPLRYASGGMPGLSLKLMYYLSRSIDPDGRRFSAIVLVLRDFAAGRWGNGGDCDRDLAYAHPLVTPADFLDLIEGCTAEGSVERTLRAVFVAGSNYRGDLHAFALNPAARIETVSAWRNSGGLFLREYPGRDAALDGLTLDPASGMLTIPATATAREAAALRVYAGQLREPTLMSAPARQYSRVWLLRIVERYAAAGTPVILAQAPRGPLHAALGGAETPDPFLVELARQGKVIMLPAALLRELEAPHFFFDERHVNKYGRPIMSAALASGLASLQLSH